VFWLGGAKGRASYPPILVSLDVLSLSWPGLVTGEWPGSPQLLGLALALFWPIRAGLLVPLTPDFLSLGWLNDWEMAKVNLAFSPGFGPLLARLG